MICHLSLFPNPANDQITIETEGTVEFARIYSAAGALIAEYATNTKTLGVSNFPNGIYLLEATISGTISRTLFVIAR